MNVDINELAHYYAKVNINIIDVGRAVIPPGKSCFGVRTPPVSGLVFPMRGRARMFFNGVPYEMQYGKVFHAGPNMSLDKEVLGHSEWDFMVVHYQTDGKEQGLYPYDLAHFQLETGHNTRINDLLHQLHCSCTTPGSLPGLRTKSLFFCVLEEILTSAANRRNESGREVVEQAMSYITGHYMEPLTIPKLAAQYGLNSKQFAYLFQKHTGMGPNDYIIEHRVRRAKELLCTTACSVSEISACVGYADPYYFSKLFKKRTGFCPSTLQSYVEKSTG